MWGISWVPWGVFSTVGDIMSTVGDIMSTVGGYLEYRGGCSVPWGDIMMHVGGYHEYRGGCSVPWGEKSIVIWVPHGTEHPPRYCTHIIQGDNIYNVSPQKCLHRLLRYSSITPHGTSMISPHGLTEHPPRYCTHIIQGDNIYNVKMFAQATPRIVYKQRAYWSACVLAVS